MDFWNEISLVSEYTTVGLDGIFDSIRDGENYEEGSLAGSLSAGTFFPCRTDFHFHYGNPCIQGPPSNRLSIPKTRSG